MLTYSNVSSRYGAPMGRTSDKPDQFIDGAPIIIERVPPSDGGDYDPGGAYWGDLSGNPLFRFDDSHGSTCYLRAPDIATARAKFAASLAPGRTPRFADDNAIDLGSFLIAYAGCALWSSTDDDGAPLDDDHSVDDIGPETMAKMRADCEAFLTQAAPLLGEWSADQAGHDFWLTRNCHGSGFWDRGLKNGDALSKLCKPFGSVDLYAGDDGKIYG